MVGWLSRGLGGLRFGLRLGDGGLLFWVGRGWCVISEMKEGHLPGGLKVVGFKDFDFGVDFPLPLGFEDARTVSSRSSSPRSARSGLVFGDFCFCFALAFGLAGGCSASLFTPSLPICFTCLGFFADFCFGVCVEDFAIPTMNIIHMHRLPLELKNALFALPFDATSAGFEDAAGGSDNKNVNVSQNTDWPTTQTTHLHPPPSPPCPPQNLDVSVGCASPSLRSQAYAVSSARIFDAAAWPASPSACGRAVTPTRCAAVAVAIEVALSPRECLRECSGSRGQISCMYILQPVRA